MSLEADGLRRDRARGLLLGGACGDALGAPFEGADMVSAESLARWEASGEPLHCTDDTALTIAVAEELVDVLAAGDELTEGPLLRRLAWVWCGADALPERWLARLPARRHLIELADELAGRAHGRRQASCFVGGAAHVGG